HWVFIVPLAAELSRRFYCQLRRKYDNQRHRNGFTTAREAISRPLTSDSPA
ncbi:uncharacterized, partial [Tachysurus ichikawai]